MTYEQLLIETDKKGLITKEKPLRANKGRIKGNKIAIKNDMTETEKKCILAEELGHYYTGAGNILGKDTMSIKQEAHGRFFAYNKLIGLSGLISAYKAGCKSLCDISEHLEVTEAFLSEALEKYRQKYGTCVIIDNYMIYFEPNLNVFEII